MLRVLHLSDIHMNYENYDTNRMKQKLGVYLQSVVKDIDIVVISGDFVYKHSSYQEARLFYNSIIEPLGISNKVFVPGNHDLNRGNTQRKTLINGYRSC